MVDTSKTARRSGNPAKRATAAPKPTASAPKTRPKSRKQTKKTATGALALLAIAAAVLSLSVVTATGPTDQPTEPTNPHTRGWATVIYEGQTFQSLLTAKADDTTGNPQRYQFGNTVEQVAAKVNFTSSAVRLADYTVGDTRLRYCITAPTGEFYAATVALPNTGDTSTTSIGTGDCDYTGGDIYTTDTGVKRGKELLDAIRPDYEYLAAQGGPDANQPLAEVLDGTHRRLAFAANDAANTIETYAAKHGEQPESVTGRSLKGLGYALPHGIRVGYYDNRHEGGYRLCLTDGTEEAVFQSTPQRKGILRHTAGTCDAT